jgi:hypothetical protein
MSIASIMLLGTVTLSLNGAQSQYTASKIASMTTTTADIIASLNRDAANAQVVTLSSPTSGVQFTLMDGTTVAYEITGTGNLTRNGNPLNSDEQQVICRDTCFTINNQLTTTAPIVTIGQQMRIENIRLESRLANRTSLENSSGQSARYTIPPSTFNIVGQRGFI